MQFVLSVMGILLCAWGFISHGGNRFSGASIAMFTAAIFVFFPGIALPLDTTLGFSNLNLVPALTICLVSTILLYYVAWKPQQLSVTQVGFIRPPVARIGFRVGLILTLVGSIAAYRSLDASGFVDGTVYVGTVLLAVSAFPKERVSPISYLIVALGFLAYMELVFTGFGRIRLASLAIAIAIAASNRWRGRKVKVAVLVLLAPVLNWLAASRVEFTATLNPNQADNVNGLGSAIGPMARFAQLIDLNGAGSLDHTWAHPFYAALVVMVPRSMWQDKPVGLGAELADIFRPDLKGTGHSELALIYGEWLLAFGVLGLLVMLPVYGWTINFIDRLMVGGSRAPATFPGLLMLTAGAILGGSIVDLLWGGSFTFTSRVGPRLIVIGLLYIASALLTRPRMGDIADASPLSPRRAAR